MIAHKRYHGTLDLILTGLFVGIGLLLPFVLGHAAGIPGVVLLPMHLPILLCGFFCGPRYGALAGIVTPILSSLLTGMPPVFPMLPIMILELSMYGFMCGFLYRRMKLPVYAALPLAMIAGRIVYAATFSVLVLTATGPVMALPVWIAVTTGAPGIAIQLLLVPILVNTLERLHPRHRDSETWRVNLMKQAERIRAGEHTCIVLQNGEVVYEAEGRGVSPLMRLYDNDITKLKNAEVADKIIGKAAAMILHLGGVKAVYGEIMSRAAVEYLSAKGIEHRYGRYVDIISNRTGNGICPIEKSVLDTDNPEEGIAVIKETIAVLMSQKSTG